MTTENTSEKTSENHPQAESSYVRVGKVLSKARRELELSVADVSRHLHLPGILVEDLESGRVDRLAFLYRRGYISNYARFLGLDAEALLSELEPDQPPELREVLPPSRRGRNLDRYLKIATYLIVTTVIVPPLVIIYLQGGWRMAQQPPATVVDTHQEQGATSSEARVATRIARALALEEETPATVGQPGHVSASALPLSAVRPVREVEPLLVDVGETTRVDMAAEMPDPGLNLALQVNGDSWVEITDADGQRLEYDLLRTGHERHYHGQAPFRILLGRASSVELYIAGERVEFAGHDRADVVQLELQLDGAVVR
jgi:cytoskeleton protein RodZ